MSTVSLRSNMAAIYWGQFAFQAIWVLYQTFLSERQVEVPPRVIGTDRYPCYQVSKQTIQNFLSRRKYVTGLDLSFVAYTTTWCNHIVHHVHIVHDIVQRFIILKTKMVSLNIWLKSIQPEKQHKSYKRSWFKVQNSVINSVLLQNNHLILYTRIYIKLIYTDTELLDFLWNKHSVFNYSLQNIG